MRFCSFAILAVIARCKFHGDNNSRWMWCWMCSAGVHFPALGILRSWVMQIAPIMNTCDWRFPVYFLLMFLALQKRKSLMSCYDVHMAGLIKLPLKWMQIISHTHTHGANDICVAWFWCEAIGRRCLAQSTARGGKAAAPTLTFWQRYEVWIPHIRVKQAGLWILFTAWNKWR